MSIIDALEKTDEVKVDLDNGRIIVIFPYDAEDVKRVKRVPGARFRRIDNVPQWWLPLDITSARILREQFGDRLKLSRAIIEWGKAQREKEEKLSALAEAQDARLPNLKKNHPELYKWMRNYQRAGAAMMAVTSCINADEPGLGKTIQTIAAILEVAPQGQHLIVAPKTSLDSVWAGHFEEFTDIPYLVVSGEDSPSERRELMGIVNEWREDGTPFALITNPAMVRYERDKDVPQSEWPVVRGKLVHPLKAAYPELYEKPWDTLVFDEYHKMGLANNKTLTFQAANDLKANHKLLLSGTPMGGKPVKLWGALHFLDPDRFTSKWRWIDEWLETEEEHIGRGQYVKKVHGIKKSKEQEFQAHIKPYMLRRLKAEVVKELPPKQYIEVWADMTPKQADQYEKFAADAELRIEEENLTATGILAEYMRLKQFAGAHQRVKNMGNGELLVLPTYESGKLPHLLEILEERGIHRRKKNKKGEWVFAEDDANEGTEQVVVFSQFSKMVDMIHQYLNEECGIPAAKITGAVKQSRRTELIEQFQAGEIRVMIVSTTAGGVALTLDNANTVVIMDETWDPDDQTQAEDRVHRISRIHQVMCYYIRSNDTIEERIRALVQGKKITNELILDLRRKGLRAI